MQWRLILTLALMVIVVIFSLANADAVQFNYIVGSKPLSLALIIIISALIGSIAGVVAGLGSLFKLRQQLSDKDHRLRDLKKDNQGLSDETKVNKEQRRPRRL